MLPFWTEHFGNPGSVTHAYGWEAAAAVEQARETLASAIAATPSEIIFTSGATEANNLALKGVAEAYLSHGRHMITLATEHPSVLDPCTYLEGLGFEISRLAVGSDGILELGQLEQALRPDTILVSVMAANNEIGVLQPIAAIGELCHQRQVLFHSDAAQAIGKIPLDVQAMKIDLLSLTAHKLYGPKGIGALYVRRRQPRVQLAPQLHGGGQERGLRSGTLCPPQIVGFAKAVEIALQDLAGESQRIQSLRDRLWQQIRTLPGIILNGHPSQRLYGNLNVSVAGVNGEALVLGLQPHLAISSGSACSSAKVAASHVLKALGRSDDLAYASVRFGIGRFNTLEDIDRAAQSFQQVVQTLQTVSSQE
jgi:cysteine desulfurase